MPSSPALQVHAVYVCLPTVGPLVEQPDGAVAYGAPQQYNQQYYVPPGQQPGPQQYYYSPPPGSQQ